MSGLTKDTIQKLTSEQQETVVTLEAHRAKKEQQLLEQARHYRGRIWFPSLVFGVLSLVCSFVGQRWIPLCITFVLFLLVEFHAAGINRRVDALMELVKKGDRHDDG